MSPTSPSDSLDMSGKKKSSPGDRGGHGGRQPSNSRLGKNDDAKAGFDNPAVKIFLVFPGEEELTSAMTSYTIPAKSFVSGKNHPSASKAIVDAVYNIIANTLGRLIPLEK